MAHFSTQINMWDYHELPSALQPGVVALIRQCTAHELAERPSFADILRLLGTLQIEGLAAAYPAEIPLAQVLPVLLCACYRHRQKCCMRVRWHTIGPTFNCCPAIAIVIVIDRNIFACLWVRPP